jgi:hypothetical protein
MEQKKFTFEEIVKIIAIKHDISFDIAESILIDWIQILHETIPESFGSEKKYIDSLFQKRRLPDGYL